MLKNIFVFLLVVILVTTAHEVLAAGMGMGPPSPPCGTPPFPPCAVPLDGGIGILATAGALYGYRKMKKK